jgi:hypothetical protein
VFTFSLKFPSWKCVNPLMTAIFQLFDDEWKWRGVVAHLPVCAGRPREKRRRILASCMRMTGLNPWIASRILLLYLGIQVLPIFRIWRQACISKYFNTKIIFSLIFSKALKVLYLRSRNNLLYMKSVRGYLRATLYKNKIWHRNVAKSVSYVFVLSA